MSMSADGEAFGSSNRTPCGAHRLAILCFMLCAPMGQGIEWVA